MSAYGGAQHGKTEARKELGLLAIAHRGTFVHQSSQASASHLVAGVIKGLQTRRPAVFNFYTPCPIEHGLADDWSRHAARLALESRAFPVMTYDPDAGSTLADCLSLEGNPAVDDPWPTYTLKYQTDDGVNGVLELPMTIADWAATEGRCKKHFRAVPVDEWNDDMVPFHEYLGLAPADREGKSAFIYTLENSKLRRMVASKEMVLLAEERRLFWSQLRQLAGLEVAPSVRDRIASALEAEFEQRAAVLKANYEKQLSDLQTTYAHAVAKRLAETLLRVAEGRTIGDLVTTALHDGAALPESTASSAPVAGDGLAPPRPSASPASAATPPPAAAAVTVAAPVPTSTAPVSDAMVIEPYVESALCTSCDECTNISKKLFAYSDDKQSYVKDPRGGTFQQLVRAAELCPVHAIHPGTPLNPKEKDLDKWVARATPFN
jgi:pyruvate-ferredoxin/flavodoxin oxidoreductase